MIILYEQRKKLFIYIGLIFISQLLMYPLPHDSYSIIQYLIPKIKFENGTVIYISGIIQLILLIIATTGLSNLERFKNKSKIVIFIVVFMILPPIMTWSIDLSRQAYHYLVGDKLTAIDIKESNISLSSVNDDLSMRVDLKLKNYGRNESKFNIRVYVPESIKEQTNKEFYDLDFPYFSEDYAHEFTIQEDIPLLTRQDAKKKLVYSTNLYRDDVVYELYNSKERVRIIRHGY